MDELAAAIASLERARNVNYVSVASTALVAYDFIITFGDEVRLVWPAKWNIGKIMFLLTRYPIFVDCALNLILVLQPFLAFDLCQPIYEAASWMCFIGIAIAEVIMAMRAYALWGKNIYAGAFLTALNIGVIIPDIILIQRAMKSLVFMPSPFPRLAPCILIAADTTVYVDLVLIMVTEFVIVVMTFYKGYTQWKETKSTLVQAFLKDGLQYFVIMFAISLANVFVFKLAVVDYSALLLLLQRVLHAMLSGRILLELREAVQATGDNGAKHGRDGMSKISTMDFAAGGGDEKTRRRVPDGLSFDAGDLDTGTGQSMIDMFGDEDRDGEGDGVGVGSETRTKPGTGTAYDSASVGDVESGLNDKDFGVISDDQVSYSEKSSGKGKDKETLAVV